MLEINLTCFHIGSICDSLLDRHPGEGNDPPTPPSLFIPIFTLIVLATIEVHLRLSSGPDLTYQVEEISAAWIASHAYQDHQV